MLMIETTDLTKRYGDVVAVDNIDLEVDAGSIHGFVGPNGAGKTTTMQMLVGLISPTEGEILIGGKPAGTIAAKELIGYAPQDPAFYGSMSGQRYLEYMGKIAGVTGVRDRATELLDMLDLTDAADQPINGYSGGMQRRVSLAQAMIHDPELLILDEPTAALDPEGRRTIIGALEGLTEEGMTIFVSSHVLAELEQFIDTVSILHDGQLVETGTIDAVQAQYGGQAFAVETSNDEVVLSLLDGREWVTNLRVEDETIIVVTDDPETFKGELQQLLADEDILLESLHEQGGLEEAFADAISGETEVASER